MFPGLTKASVIVGELDIVLLHEYGDISGRIEGLLQPRH